MVFLQGDFFVFSRKTSPAVIMALIPPFIAWLGAAEGGRRSFPVYSNSL